MIVGARSLQRSDFRGFNVLTFADWNLPVETLGLTCMAAFDEALLRLRSDPEATRIAVPGSVSASPTTRVNTATESALRALPERYAPSARFHSLFVQQEGLKRVVWTDFPAWVQVRIETREGTLDAVSFSPPNTTWRTFVLEDRDLRIHLSLIQGLCDFRPTLFEEPRFFRSAELIRAPRVPARFALELEP